MSFISIMRKQLFIVHILFYTVNLECKCFMKLTPDVTDYIPIGPLLFDHFEYIESQIVILFTKN